MGSRRFTLILAALTALVLLLSAPTSLREAWSRGGFYLFSRDFVEDIPRRLKGPGRFRFVFQPMAAVILGIRSGREDRRAGRPSFLLGLFRPGLSRGLLRSGFQAIGNLLMMGILLDSVFQWLLFGNSYPGAALVVGPVLITLPYGTARALANLGPRGPGATAS